MARNESAVTPAIGSQNHIINIFQRIILQYRLPRMNIESGIGELPISKCLGYCNRINDFSLAVLMRIAPSFIKQSDSVLIRFLVSGVRAQWIVTMSNFSVTHPCRQSHTVLRFKVLIHLHKVIVKNLHLKRL